MSARDALRSLNVRLRNSPGFGPVVGPEDGDYWSPPKPPAPRAPLDYAVGCVDPIEEEPERLVVPAAFDLIEWTLLGSILALGAFALWFGFGG